ncbi:Periplasmic binding protein [Brucella suis]|nr:Periplasmic binding protein [Brucella suis]
MAEIFNVQDRGEKVIADLKAREEAARKKIASPMAGFPRRLVLQCANGH